MLQELEKGRHLLESEVDESLEEFDSWFSHNFGDLSNYFNLFMASSWPIIK